jgi:hypothetical protein
VGLRWRKVFQAGRLRWTVSRSGVGSSVGVPGLRVGVTPDGRRYITIGLPGTGFYYTCFFGRRAGPNSSTAPPKNQAEPVESTQTPKEHWV